MHSVANLATLQTPLATFFPSKKQPNLVSENHWDCRASASRGLALPARAHTSLSLRLLCSARAHLSLSLSASALFSARTPLSLSLSLCVCSARGRERSSALIQLNRYYVASLILHASRAEITAQLLSLSYVYLISSDDGAIIMIFCAD